MRIKPTGTYAPHEFNLTGKHMIKTFRFPDCFSKVAVLLLLSVALAGCGKQTYESRLAATAIHFEHQQELNRELGKTWNVGGMSFRPPKQFQLIPAPEPGEDKDGNQVMPEIDERQPFKTFLPGMMGAWSADLTIEQEEGEEAEQVEAFIYVLSSFPMWVAQDQEIREQAPDFLQVAADVLRDVFSVGIDGWQPEKFPRKSTEGFVPVVLYDSVSLKPDSQFRGGNVTLSLFLHSNGDNIAYIVFVVPEDVASTEKLGRRRSLALETFVLPASKPTSLDPKTGQPTGGRSGGAGF